METPGNRAREVRILLVDDHPVMREGLRGLLRAEPMYRVCGEASTAAEALKLAREDPPDVVIADLSLPGTGGLDLIRDLQTHLPAVQVLVLSMHDERLHAERALRAGARGYVMKQDPPERILEGLRAVAAGELYVSSEVASSLLSAFVGTSAKPDRRVGVERLSDRELEVFERIGRGQTTREIAEQLCLSPKTVGTYRGHIKRKLGLSHNNGLIHAAIHWVEQGNGTGTESTATPVRVETPSPRGRRQVARGGRSR
jgi:DNA-binding NarL/FixJ family response regulator